MKNNSYTISHSPDADDIFMYYAIAFGWVSTPYSFENIMLDIESLNKSCLEAQYDVSAMSFAVYPMISRNYAMLRTGMSFGDGYGPKIVKLRGKLLKRNFKVALSGEHTTNALIFRMYYPNARVVYRNFLEIESSVLSGEVDAGVLIHESILNFDKRLCVEACIWDIWSEINKQNLPLPLGGMVISRRIPINKAIKIEKALARAIRIAIKHKSTLSEMLIRQKLVRVDKHELSTYLNMYANESSHSMSENQINAIEKLYELGYNAGIYSEKLRLNDFFVPSEYEELRFNGGDA